jgi:signal peptidase II
MKKNRLFWLVAIVGLVLDRITKYWVEQNFTGVGDTFPLWKDVFHFTYVINTGAAFSAFRGGVGWLRWLSLGVSLLLAAFALYGPKLTKLEQLGYGCILAGALGNGIDRFFLSYVVDFLDFRAINFPVFNIADVAINLGIIWLLLSSFGMGTRSRNWQK